MKNIVAFSQWIIKSCLKIAIAFILVYLTVNILKEISNNDIPKGDTISVTDLRNW